MGRNRIDNFNGYRSEMRIKRQMKELGKFAYLMFAIFAFIALIATLILKYFYRLLKWTADKITIYSDRRS